MKQLRLTVTGIAALFIFGACASDQNVREQVKALETRQTFSTTVFNKQIEDIVSIQRKTEQILETVVENQEDILKTSLRNQADIKEGLEKLFKEINRVNGRLEENTFQTKTVSEDMVELEKQITNMRIMVMEANMQNSQKAELLRESIEADLDEIGVLLKRKKRKPVKKLSKKTAVSKSASAEDLYNSAYNNFINGRYAQAEEEFHEYVKRNPNTDLSDNSQFWLGESLANQGKLKEAVEAFNLVATRYPNSTKTPTALWRSAELLQKLGSPEKSRQTLKELADGYPGSSEAANARKKLKQESKKRKNK